MEFKTLLYSDVNFISCDGIVDVDDVVDFPNPLKLFNPGFFLSESII